VQTGTAHGGFINADGTLRMDVKIDLQTLAELSRVAREDYRLAGAVQHGASTLPPEAFDAFPRVGACEIHLARTSRTWCTSTRSSRRSQARDVRVGARQRPGGAQADGHRGAVPLQGAQEGARPVQAEDVELDDEARRAIGRTLEEQFTFLMTKLKIPGTAPVVARFVKAPAVAIDREKEIVAAGGKITAAEKKAEGLAD